MLVPKLFSTLKTYDRAQFVADLTAGVIVGIVALPLAIAFAIASGVTPDRGLYTAIVAGFVISVLGGSRVQIGGPTGAFVVVVYGIVQQHGLDGLVIATFMAGVILIGLGLTRFGSAIKFVPHPVVLGFTSGIALIILSSQVRDFLGLQMGDVPSHFIEKWIAYAKHMHDFNPNAIAIAIVSLIIITQWPRVSRRIPGPFVALIATTAAVRLLHLDVETIGSRFGEITSSLPQPHLPHASLETVRALVAPAFTIALLAGIESLLSAVVADGMIGGRHRSNMELIAQGVANIGSAAFGGMPATGAIARTATNVKNGGRTPVAGIVHALTLLIITLFFGKWAGYIPFATLAAILIIVAYHMSEWRGFIAELSAPKSDAVVMIITFGLTVLIDLTVAIQVGMVLSAFLFMKRMAEVTNMQVVTRELDDNGDEPSGLIGTRVPDHVQVFEINGPFFFGAAQTFRDNVEPVLGGRRVLIFRLRNVPAIDSTGLHALRHVVRRTHDNSSLILLCEIQAQPLQAMERAGLVDEIGVSNILPSIEDAFARAEEFKAAAWH